MSDGEKKKFFYNMRRENVKEAINTEVNNVAEGSER